MNARDVVNELVRKGGNPKRMGLTEGFWTDTIFKWVKQGYPTQRVYKLKDEAFRRDEDGMMDVAPEDGWYVEPEQPWRHFGFDMVGGAGRFDLWPIRGYSEVVEENDQWVIRRNGAGASLKYWKHKMGTPEHIDFRMTSREVWERDYKPFLLEWDAERVNLKLARKSYAELKEAGVWQHFGQMFIWEIMRQSLGDVTLYTSLLTDPDWIHDINRTYTVFFKRYYTYIFEQVGLPDGMWLFEDMGYNAGLFASPKTFEKLIFPYYREMVDFFHAYNLPVILHSCGSVAQAMPLIVDAGFDALNPMERKAKGNDPFAFAEKYGDRLAFVGGLDIRHLESNDKDVVKREVVNYVEGMKSRGARLVFAVDHSVPPTVDYDTYRYAVDVYREHMWY